MKIFVINAYPDRREKYDERYELFPAVWWEDVVDEEKEKYHFYWNAKIDHCKKVVACSLSHKKVLQKIINEDLKEVVIIEDDALIEDFEKLDILKEIKEFCYIGGQINAPLIKDFKAFESIKDAVRENFTTGINTIDPSEFRLTHACGYYIPDARVAQDILSNIPHNNKERAIDVEFLKLQKKEKITKFIYPAIVTLYLPDAKKGFTYSKYKLIDDQWLY